MYKIIVSGITFHVDAETKWDAIKAVAQYVKAMGIGG
jgi:hypothetical protein